MSGLLLETIEQHVFYEKYEVDHRVPLLYLAPTIGVTSTVALDPTYMLQAATTMALAFGSYMVAAVVTYYACVQHRGTSVSVLVGWGVVLPFLLAVPFGLVQLWDVRNAVLLIYSAGGVAVIVPRLFEAMSGTLPDSAAQSLPAFMLYFSVFMVFRQDDDTKQFARATYAECRDRAQKIAVQFVVVSLLYSALLPDYKVFPHRPTDNVLDWFFWGNIGNNFLIAALMSLVIDVSSSTGGLVIAMLTGLSTEDVNAYPLLLSKTIAEFWGKRWNKLVAAGLKQGIYKPCRLLGLSQAMGAAVTFLASGLFHEYALVVLTTRHGNANNPHHVPYQHSVGHQLLFFLYNALLLLIEYEVLRQPFMMWVDKHVPNCFRTAVVVLSVCPIGHYFVDEYINSGILSDASMFFPRIIWQSSPQL